MFYQFQIINTPRQKVQWIAEAFNQSIKVNGKGLEMNNQWKHWAVTKLIIMRIDGFVKQRKIAYGKVGFCNPYHIDCLKSLEVMLYRLKGKKPSITYKIILAYEDKLRAILPSKANNLTIDLNEILDFCKKMTNNI
jgi:hypothetical protein